MKLHWVELENWRQHAKTTIEFDEKATVIYGPNETGKSGILEALSKGFFDKSSSHAEAIKRVKPKTASGNVTSSVQIEFTLNKTRYRVEKNFNLRRGTSLYKIADEKPQLLGQDNSADEQLIHLLEADLPSTRGSKPSQWGAFHWLWAPQDHRELPTDKEGDPTSTLHLETKEGGGLLVTPKFKAVQSLAQISFAKYFTKRGRTSINSPISDIENETQTLKERSVELRMKIKSVDDEKQQLEELQRGLPLLGVNISGTKEELEKARSDEIDLSAIESKLKASEASVKEAERDVQDAKKGLEELEQSAEKIEELQEKEKKSRESLSETEAFCELLGKKQREINEKVEEKAMKIRESEELTRDARILWTKSDTFKKIKEVKNKIKKIEDINVKIESLREKEVAIVPPSDEIEKLIKSQIRIETLKENLVASGLAINITPGEKGSLEVEVDGERIKGGKLTVTGTESVSVGAPGFGKVTVNAKLAQARDAKVDIKRLEESVQGTLTKYGTDSIDELKELNRIQNEISNSKKEFVAEKRGVDERSVDEIILDLKKLEEKYKEFDKIERTPNVVALNPTDADLGKLMEKREKEETDARAILDEARVKRDEDDKELTKKREELVKIRAERKHFSKDLEDARNQERELIRQYGSVEIQEKILRIAEAKLDERTEEYKKINEKHEGLEKGPINRIKRLKQEIEHHEQIIKNQRTFIDQLKGAISKASLEGSYSKLAEIESRMEILSERLGKEQISAESTKLLNEALEQQYHSALSVVVGPIQEEVKHALGYVTGFLHDDVELNEYLFPTRLGERGFEDISLEFNDGSSGLKEILALCVRLAVAKHLSGRDSQCLVLDDPFVHVSSDRSNKMIELINESIKEYELQVIVFTHRSMEFAGFTGKMIDIQSVK